MNVQLANFTLTTWHDFINTIQNIGLSAILLALKKFMNDNVIIYSI